MGTVSDKKSRFVLVVMCVLFAVSVALTAWRSIIAHDFVIVDDVSEEDAET